MVPYSKNRRQYLFLFLLLSGLALMFLVGAGPGWALAFLIGTPLAATGFAGFHRRRTP